MLRGKGCFQSVRPPAYAGGMSFVGVSVLAECSSMVPSRRSYHTKSLIVRGQN